MSRQHFVAIGKLFPCPNPRHEFSFGRLIGQWQWASEAWSNISESGNLVTTFLSIDMTETPDGLKFTKLTIWKLCVWVGLKRISMEQPT